MSDIVVAIILLPIMSQKQTINCPFYFSNVPNISLLNGVNGKEVVEERKTLRKDMQMYYSYINV